MKSLRRGFNTLSWRGNKIQECTIFQSSNLAFLASRPGIKLNREVGVICRHQNIQEFLTILYFFFYDNDQYHIIYYTIKVGFRSCGCAKWLHQIAENLSNFCLKIKFSYFVAYNYYTQET